MDIEFLKKHIQFTEDKVIIDKKIYDEVFMVSMNNAMDFKVKMIHFHNWLREEFYEKSKRSLESHSILVSILNKFDELMKGI